jgi:uncharacterized membrane protein
MSLHNRLPNKDQPLPTQRSKISSDHISISHGSGGGGAGGGSGNGGGNDENNKEEEKMQDALS